MYGKIFQQIYDGSLRSDPMVRLVFMDMVILADQDGIVDMTHEALSARTNVDIKTIHESTDIMADFNPPNCSGNLIMNSIDGRPVFIDFQGFLLNDEEKIINEIIEVSKEKVHFGDVRFYRKKKK